MDTKLRRLDDQQIQDLETRFDRHLEIYANNGKELQGVKDELKNLVLIVQQHITTHEEDFKELKSQIKPFTDLSTAGRITWKIVLGIGILLGIFYSLTKLK